MALASSRGFALFSIALLFSGCHKPAPQGGPPPAEVGIVTVAERPVPIELSYMARTAGIREIEVRARVSGILQRKLYKEGSRVKEGDLLFRIDPAPYAAEAERARADMGVTQAKAVDAKRQLERTEPLVKQGVVSRREYDQAVADSESAQAALQSAKAALRKTELDLSYTEVRAPISGLTSREARSEGSLVNAADDTALRTRISQTDRLYIEFSMPVSEAMMVREVMQRSGAGEVQVVVQTAQGQDLPQKAALGFVDTLVDQTSGTVQVRATLPNSNAGLLPGDFVRARIQGLTLPQATAVPARAVLRSAMGSIVWVVGPDNKVQPRPVQLGQTSGNDVIVVSGLKSGDQVIVDGVIKVQPGAVVKPVPTTVH